MEVGTEEQASSHKVAITKEILVVQYWGCFVRIGYRCNSNTDSPESSGWVILG